MHVYGGKGRDVMKRQNKALWDDPTLEHVIHIECLHACMDCRSIHATIAGSHRGTAYHDDTIDSNQ